MTKTTIPKIKTGKYASGNPFWRVTYSQDGKQVIKKFKTEREANEHRMEVIRKFHGGISMQDQEVSRLALEKFKAHHHRAGQIYLTCTAGDGDITVFEWLAQHFEGRSFKFGQLVEK